MRTLEILIERAERKGEATLNGRMRGMFGEVGELREKYYVEIDGDIVTLGHWGTQTLKINTRTKLLMDIYGESVSDRDSINYMLRKYDMPYHTHFYPSKGGFEVHTNADDVLHVI